MTGRFLDMPISHPGIKNEMELGLLLGNTS